MYAARRPRRRSAVAALATELTAASRSAAAAAIVFECGAQRRSVSAARATRASAARSPPAPLATNRAQLRLARASPLAPPEPRAAAPAPHCSSRIAPRSFARSPPPARAPISAGALIARRAAPARRRSAAVARRWAWRGARSLRQPPFSAARWYRNRSPRARPHPLEFVARGRRWHRASGGAGDVAVARRRRASCHQPRRGCRRRAPARAPPLPPGSTSRAARDAAARAAAHARARLPRGTSGARIEAGRARRIAAPRLRVAAPSAVAGQPCRRGAAQTLGA